MKARDFIEDIIITRHRFGLTQKAAAKEIGVHVQTLRSWENRTRSPNRWLKPSIIEWIKRTNLAKCK